MKNKQGTPNSAATEHEGKSADKNTHKNFKPTEEGNASKFSVSPSKRVVLELLLSGITLHHHHFGKQHRLAITIHRLRVHYGLKDYIHTGVRGSPIADHYYIKLSDCAEVRAIANNYGLLG